MHAGTCYCWRHRHDPDKDRKWHSEQISFEVHSQHSSVTQMARRHVTCGMGVPRYSGMGVPRYRPNAIGGETKL